MGIATLLLCIAVAVVAVAIALYLVYAPSAQQTAWERFGGDVPQPPYRRIHVSMSIVISMDDPKGTTRLEQLRTNFGRYALPPIEVHRPTPRALMNDDGGGVIHPYAMTWMTAGQTSLTHAYYECLQKVARGPADWAYLFEDDARVVNAVPGADLTTMLVPDDAEAIVVSRGRDAVWDATEPPQFEPTCAGGLTHAFLVSRTGAAKLVQAIVPIWHVIDIVLFKAACTWQHKQSKYQNEAELRDHDDIARRTHGAQNAMHEPCVRMYESVRLFDQTSNPSPPARTDGMQLDELHHLIMQGRGGYAVGPVDWEPSSTSLS